MSSPSPGFQVSSPAHGAGRRKSQFTYRQLAMLASYSTSSPLRVIAHIDLDAFYAQCGMYNSFCDGCCRHCLLSCLSSSLLAASVHCGHAATKSISRLICLLYYAEMVRLGIDEEQPLAVQQWYLPSPTFISIPFHSSHPTSTTHVTV